MHYTLLDDREETPEEYAERVYGYESYEESFGFDNDTLCRDAGRLP